MSDSVIVLDNYVLGTNSNAAIVSNLAPENIRKDVTILGVTGTFEAPIQPSLNAPAIAKSGNNVNITNPATNGNFNESFGCYNNNVKFKEQTNAILDLQKIDHNKYLLTVQCQNPTAGFLNSINSNSITLTVYAFEDCTYYVSTNFDWKNNSDGISINFTIVPETGYYLPASIDILCNGERLDYSYNPYTGEVHISALELSYEGTLSDMGTLATPYIENIVKDTATIKVSAGTETFLFYYADGTSIGSISNPSGDDTTIQMGIVGLDSAKLVAPDISLNDQTLIIVDGYLKTGDTFYAEYYDLYIDGVLTLSDIDATQDQNMVISYEILNNFAKQSTGYYKSTNTGAQTYGLVKASILTPSEKTVRVDYTAQTRSSYCYAYLGKLDATFSNSYSQESSTNYQVAYTNTAANTSSYNLTVPKGAHFVYFKFWRGNTSSYTDRYLQIKVTEVTE